MRAGQEYTRAPKGHYPAKAKHILGLVGNMRAGALNDPAFHARMRGYG